MPSSQPRRPCALFLRRLRWFALLVARRFVADRCARVASALSFTTVLALVPLTAVSLAVLALFPVFASWMDALQQFIYSNFMPAAGDVVSEYVQRFAANAEKLTVWGLVFLVATALMLMGTIERTFNDIWHAEHRRKLVHRFLAYWTILTLTPILIGLSLSLTSYVISLPLFGRQSPFGFFRALALDLLPVVLEILAFLLLYTVTPNRRVRVRDALIGSVFAALLFECAKRGFALFVTKFAAYQIVYGAVAALPVFLIWIYLSWTVILLGAVVTAALPEWNGEHRVRRRVRKPRRARRQGFTSL